MSLSAQTAPIKYEHPFLSHYEVYGGYGYWQPLSTQINGTYFSKISNLNATLSATDYFSRHLGVQVEGGYFSGNSKRGLEGQCAPGCASRDQLVYTAQAGPVYRLPMGRFVPYAHVLAGGTRLNGPFLQPATWGFGMTAGGGLDYVLPVLHDRIALRVFQADFQYSHVVYPTATDPNFTGTADLPAVKLSAGLVVRMGRNTVPEPVNYSCAVSPATIYAGDPITVTGTPAYMKKPGTYTWSSNGGTISGNSAMANVDTKSVAPGTYTIKGHVSEGSKPTQNADCTAEYTVKAFDPPVVSCSASPSSVNAGDASTITTSATSPQNRPLTYSYSATAGSISGSSASSTLTTNSAAPGPITVTCNAVDDKGQTASGTTTVTVLQPKVMEVPATNLCSISFTRDARRPARVNNEAKACLDDIALNLQRSSDAKLDLVGNASGSEDKHLAADRALNTRMYLVNEKGIDSSRITVYTGSEDGQTVTTTLVPTGATANTSSWTVVDESAPVTPKRHHKR